MPFPKMMAVLIVATSLTIASPSFGQSTEAPAKADEKVTAAVPELPPIPESFEHATVSAYIEKLNRIRPKEQSRASVAALVKALGSRVDELLAKPVEGEAAQEAIGFRFSLFRVSEQLGVPGVSDAKAKWIDSLKSDKRPLFATMGRGLALLEATQTPDVATGKREAWEEIFNSTDKLLAETNASAFAANITMQISEMSEMAAPADLAAKAHEAFAKRFAGSDVENVRQAAAVLEGVGRKLGLPGNKMVVSGQTINGKPFEMTQLEGQVVLVEYWATWCHNCIASFPELEKIYQKHHDSGLEIVGVNIDDTKSLWTEYLDSRPLPWMQIQDLDSGEVPRHPSADRYGINAIPFMVLIGRDGKVIRTDVVPEELETLIPTVLAKKAE